MPSLARNGDSGRKSDITTVPSQLTPNSFVTLNEGVQILASPDNTEAIYVGTRSTITANSSDALDGFPLVAGASLFVPCRQLSDVWVRSLTTTCVLWFFTR